MYVNIVSTYYIGRPPVTRCKRIGPLVYRGCKAADAAAANVRRRADAEFLTLVRFCSFFFGGGARGGSKAHTYEIRST